MSWKDPYAIEIGYRYRINIESSLGNEQKSKMVRRCNDTSCRSINFVSAMALNKTFVVVVTHYGFRYYRYRSLLIKNISI